MADKVLGNPSPSILGGWRIIKRVALTITWVIPLVVCIGTLVGIIPREPFLSQPYFLPLLVVGFGTTIVLVLWYVSRMETSGADTTHYTPIQELNLVGYYTWMGTLHALLGLGITIVLLGYLSPKYLIGVVSVVFGVFIWLTGYVRFQQLGVVLTQKMSNGMNVEVRNLLHRYKIYYVDRRLLMMCAYFITGIGAVTLYLSWRWNQYVSLWDLYGFLLLLISSGLWDYLVGKRVETITHPSKRQQRSGEDEKSAR